MELKYWVRAADRLVAGQVRQQACGEGDADGGVVTRPVRPNLS